MQETGQRRQFLVPAIMILLAGLAASAAPQDKGTDYAGKGHALYDQYCVSCHGPSGKGDGVAATSLKVRPADLTTISKRYKGFPEEKMMEYIEGEKYAVGHGSRTMPVWGKRLRRDDATGKGDVFLLAKYLASIQKP